MLTADAALVCAIENTLPWNIYLFHSLQVQLVCAVTQPRAHAGAWILWPLSDGECAQYLSSDADSRLVATCFKLEGAFNRVRCVLSLACVLAAIDDAGPMTPCASCDETICGVDSTKLPK